MGAFKPLLPFGERTLVDHVVTNLRAAGVARIHVVTGFQADALAPELARLGVTRAHNPDFAAGMFSSVRAGVASLPADVDAFLLAPVDVPLLRPSTIARILRAAARARFGDRLSDVSRQARPSAARPSRLVRRNPQ